LWTDSGGGQEWVIGGVFVEKYTKFPPNAPEMKICGVLNISTVHK